MTSYELHGDRVITEPVARTLDAIAWHHRSYPLPSYEERRHQLAQKRAEVQTAAQRQIAKRNTDPSHVSPNGKAPE